LGSEHGSGGQTASLYSGASSPDGQSSYMTGFGQAAETMRDDNAMPGPAMMTMAEGAPLLSHHSQHHHRRSLSGGLELAHRDVPAGGGDTNEGPSPYMVPSSSSHRRLSSTRGKEAAGPGSKSGSYEEDIFAPHPTRSSSSQLIASSSSEVGSSNDNNRRSGEGRRPSIGAAAAPRQTPTPPTSYSFRKRAGSDNHSLKDILGRLRGARKSSPGPIAPDTDIQIASPPSSASPLVTRFPDSVYSPPTSSASPYVPIIYTRSPTPPPSSLLNPQPQSQSQSQGMANGSNYNRGTSAESNGDRPWPALTLPTFPSPAVSDDSHEVTSEGLLDPRLPWRLEQTRVDSTTSLRDHEDYSRPIGRLLVHNRHPSNTTLDTHNTTTIET
jgi:hypothetical protein